MKKIQFIWTNKIMQLPYIRIQSECAVSANHLPHNTYYISCIYYTQTIHDGIRCTFFLWFKQVIKLHFLIKILLICEKKRKKIAQKININTTKSTQLQMCWSPFTVWQQVYIHLFFFASFITQLKQVFYGQLFVIIDRCLTFICDWENIENIGKKKKNSSRISNRSFLTSSLPFYEWIKKEK